MELIFEKYNEQKKRNLSIRKTELIENVIGTTSINNRDTNFYEDAVQAYINNMYKKEG
jgi:hypothetical protein